MWVSNALIEEQTRGNELLVDELRSELKLLSRTIAAGFDERAADARAGAPALGGVTRDEEDA